jgi:hypothetical protein
MDHKDSLFELEEERRRGEKTAKQKSVTGPSSNPGAFATIRMTQTTRTKCERGICKNFGR